MVDFQSRDTRRDTSGDDEDEEETEAETEADSGTEPETAEPAGSGSEADGAEAEAAGQDHSEAAAHDHGAGHHHADAEELGVAVVTVSTSRSLDDDPSGDAIEELVEGDGHEVVAHDLVADDLDGIQRAMLALTGREDVDIVITTGGTGVTPDDVTVEAVEPLFDKGLPGFGELFRIRSYEEVGTRALGSRATAGVSEGVPVFCLPGSENAVRTAIEELVLAEAPHLVGLARGE
ncbi:molybdenum cofactor biosynthesis protein B [Halobacteriales archaeon QS_5_68_33]|nr:MAG: molybdenum cofactor biosynthesis protein B [Halobacteriales archaeon QS_5_68_33]